MATILKVFVVICLTTLYSCLPIKSKAPSLADKEIPTIQQQNSKIEVPIILDLEKFFVQAENSAPNEYTDKKQPCQGLQYAYLFKRPPFNIVGSGNKVNLSFQGEYWVDMTYCATCINNKCVPKIKASCGIGEPMRKINIGYSSKFNILDDYRLSSSTSLVTLDPINRCTVSILNIDVTDRLIGFVKEPLNKLSERVDERFAKVDLKPRVQKVWNRLSSEIKLGDLGYLYINPQALNLSSFNIKGSVLKLSVNMYAKPFITTEIKEQPIAPLPDLSNSSPGNGLNAYCDVFVSYDTLSKYLNEKIAGQTIKVRWHKFIITNSKVYGIGNQKMVIETDFKGSRKGTIYFTGTPRYDSISHELTFEELDLKLKTRDPLLLFAKWLFDDKITSKLEERARYDFSDILKDARQKLQKGINRDLSDNIVLSGEIDDLAIKDIYPMKSKVLLRALATGKLEIKIQE